jgi:arabinofuranosyltransferase
MTVVEREPAVATRERRLHSASTSSWSARVSLVVPALVLAAGGWSHRWVSEDGFITLRVVRQLLDGNGPVFNAGERVEAVTSPAWMFLLAFLRFIVPVPLEWLAVVAGLAGAVAGLLLASWAAGRLWTTSAPYPEIAVVPLGALVVAVLPPVWDFTTSGLEMGLVFGWLGASAAVLARAATTDAAAEPALPLRQWAGPVAVGLGFLVRPDLAVCSACFVVALLICDGGPARRKAKVAAVALALPVAYQLFRMGYYAALVPNPGLAKEGTAARWDQGLHYLRNLTGPYRLAIPLGAATVALAALLWAGRREAPAARRFRIAAAALAPLVAGLLHGLFVVRVGGDFMHGRLLLPAVFACLTPVMVVPARPVVARLAAVVTVAWVVARLTALPAPGPAVDAHGIVNERAFWHGGRGGHLVRAGDFTAFPHYREGRLARDRLDRGETGFAVRPNLDVEEYVFVPFREPAPARVGIEEAHVGIVGMLAGSNVFVFDRLGLADPLGSRLRLQARSRPGHEKIIDRSWTWAQFVDPAAPPLERGPDPAAVEAARQALRCPALRDLTAAVRERLTPGRFVTNLVNSLRWHRFRFDNDPFVARDRLCQDGS